MALYCLGGSPVSYSALLTTQGKGSAPPISHAQQQTQGLLELGLVEVEYAQLRS